MGNCFSDPSAPKAAKKSSTKPQGQGHVLGSAPTPSAQPIPSSGTAGPAVNNGAGGAPLSPPMMSPGRMLGDGFEDANRGNDPRSVAAAAAEERMKSANKRGVQNGGGKLTAKLEAERRKPLYGNDNNQDQPMNLSNYN